MNWMLLAAAVIVIAAAAVVAAVFAQRSMLFPAPSHYRTPAEAGLDGFVEDPVETPDGNTVMVWSHAAEPGERVVLSFHGNGDSLPHHDSKLAAWADAGYGVHATTYRGYPGSTGRPSEARLVRDALAIFDRLVSRDGVAPGDVILAGFSLGSAVAMAVAAQREPGAVFLEGAMSSIADVGKHHFPFVPVRLVILDPFDSLARAAQVDAPVFLVHGSEDPTVPLYLGERLHAALPEPKAMMVVEGGTHVLPVGTGWDEFEAFLDRHASRRDGAG